MKLIYKLKWSKGDDEWHLINPIKGTFIMKFPDCENFRRQFDRPDKRKEKLYIVDVRLMNKEK